MRKLVSTVTVSVVLGAALATAAPTAIAEGGSATRLAAPAALAKTDAAARPDTDGDALPDAWEQFGVTVGPGTSTTVGRVAGGTFIDLPAMGADPRHKDIFIHADYMVEGHRLKAAALQMVANAFQKSPLTNPDGATGVTLHVDTGPDSIMNPVTGATWGRLSQVGKVPYQQGVSDADIPALRTAHFDPAHRAPVFYYACACDQFDAALGHPSTSGVANGLPGDGFVVTLGAWETPGGTVEQQAGTFMHELGHVLGLGHGGSDHENTKPNYLSVMNYAYQMTGWPSSDGKFSFDYSHFRADIDEHSLSEPNGIGSAQHRAPVITQNGQDTQCPVDGEEVPDYLVLPVPAVDWNANCRLDANGTVAADVNGDGALTVLNGNLDWKSGDSLGVIYFGGGAVGGSIGGSEPNPAAITPDIDQQQVARVESTDVLQRQAVTPDPGFTVDRSFGVAPLTVNFDASATEDDDDGPRTYRWDFGDGTTGTGLTATHQYATPGVYDAWLSVTDAQGHTSVVDVFRTITVTAPTVTAVGVTGNAGVGVAGVLLFASVTPGTAAGTVAFADGADPIAGCATRPVNAATAGFGFGLVTCVTSFDTAGPHTITAVYDGGAAFAPSSATITVDVTSTPDLAQVLWGLLIRFAHDLQLFGL